MKQNCIKCSAPYETSDPDPYYCPPCFEEHKLRAAEIDSNRRPRKAVKSGLQLYDSLPKVRGFVNARDIM